MSSKFLNFRFTKTWLNTWLKHHWKSLEKEGVVSLKLKIYSKTDRYECFLNKKVFESPPSQREKMFSMKSTWILIEKLSPSKNYFAQREKLKTESALWWKLKQLAGVHTLTQNTSLWPKLLVCERKLILLTQLVISSTHFAAFEKVFKGNEWRNLFCHNI